MGLCDRSKGECKCAKGFEGGACERLSCPKADGEICGGHGSCYSMQLLAQETTLNGDPTAYSYGVTLNNRHTWYVPYDVFSRATC